MPKSKYDIALDKLVMWEEWLKHPATIELIEKATEDISIAELVMRFTNAVHDPGAITWSQGARATAENIVNYGDEMVRKYSAEIVAMTERVSAEGEEGE